MPACSMSRQIQKDTIFSVINYGASHTWGKKSSCQVYSASSRISFPSRPPSTKQTVAGMSGHGIACDHKHDSTWKVAQWSLLPRQYVSHAQPAFC